MSGRHFVVLAALLLASSCSKSSHTTPSTAATATPTPGPYGQNLYVANDAAGGGISQYTLPLTTGETASFTVALANPITLSFDSFGDLAAGTTSGAIDYYGTPFKSSSTTSATFSNGGSPGQITFLSGALYTTANGTTVNVFAPPFSNASTPSYTISPTGANALAGVTFDASGTLYVANNVAGSGPANIISIVPPAPYTGTTTATPAITGTIYRKLAVYGTLLFAANVGGTTGSVDVYSIPLSSTSAPSYSITSGIDTPEALAFDQSGRLYVGNAGNSTVTVYTPSFSASSTPTTTLALPGGFAVFGIAVGP